MPRPAVVPGRARAVPRARRLFWGVFVCRGGFTKKCGGLPFTVRDARKFFTLGSSLSGAGAARAEARRRHAGALGRARFWGGGLCFGILSGRGPVCRSAAARRRIDKTGAARPALRLRRRRLRRRRPGARVRAPRRRRGALPRLRLSAKSYQSVRASAPGPSNINPSTYPSEYRTNLRCLSLLCLELGRLATRPGAAGAA